MYSKNILTSLNKPSGKLLTKAGQPTLEELEDWQASAKEITLTVHDYIYSQETTIKGIITRIDTFGSKTDALISLDTYQFGGIYLRNVIAYSLEPEIKIILDENDDLKFPDAVILKTEKYHFRVNKHVLSDKCEYFKRMFQAGMIESYSGEIDLSHTFNQKTLDILLNFLDKNEDKIESLDDALALLIAGDIVSSQEIMERALQLISKKLYIKKFEDLIENLDQLHPLISTWVLNIQAWLKKYPTNLHISDLILQLPKDFLYSDDTDEYEKKMHAYCQQLKILTNIDWSYDGIKLNSSRNYTSYTDKPKHPNNYSNKVIEILIARGILSGKQCVSGDYTWACKIIDSASLLKLDTNKLRDEIEEASLILSETTGHPCNYLELYPVPDGSYYRVLEEIGCISVKEFFAHNVTIKNFDITKLRLLKNEAITMKELWARYEATDKKQSLSSQIFKLTQKNSAVHTEKETNPTTLSFSLSSDKKENQPPSSKDNSDNIGFKRWF